MESPRPRRLMRTVFILDAKHFDINQNFNICCAFLKRSERRWHEVTLVKFRPVLGFDPSENAPPCHRHAASLQAVRASEAAAAALAEAALAQAGHACTDWTAT